MVRFMGVTEFQRRLRSVFSEVVERQVRVVLTRNGHPPREHYILFELAVESAFATTYPGGGAPQRRRWQAEQ